MEYLDILDKEGKPTSEKRDRREVHVHGDWHNVVHVYVFRRKNGSFEILVHLRSKTKDASPDRWDTRFGGHVKSGESVEDTVINELKEEIGINVKTENLIKGPVQKWDGGANREFVNIYFYKFFEEDLKFNDGEVQEVKWMSVDDICNSLRKNKEKWTGMSPEGFIEKISILKSLGF